MVPPEGKKLIATELKSLISIRKKIRHYFHGAIAGGALQIYRIKRELQDELARELITAKTNARLERIKLLKKTLTDIESVIPATTEKDIVLSTMAAESFSNAWANAHVLNMALDPDARLRRIVATETARSFSDVSMEAADNYKLVRRWNAILDAKVCAFCESMDGEETLPGETFKGGTEPGYAHPNCRCYSDLVIK